MRKPEVSLESKVDLFVKTCNENKAKEILPDFFKSKDFDSDSKRLLIKIQAKCPNVLYKLFFDRFDVQNSIHRVILETLYNSEHSKSFNRYLFERIREDLNNPLIWEVLRISRPSNMDVLYDMIHEETKAEFNSEALKVALLNYDKYNRDAVIIRAHIGEFINHYRNDPVMLRLFRNFFDQEHITPNTQCLPSEILNNFQSMNDEDARYALILGYEEIVNYYSQNIAQLRRIRSLSRPLSFIFPSKFPPIDEIIARGAPLVCVKGSIAGYVPRRLTEKIRVRRTGRFSSDFPSVSYARQQEEITSEDYRKALIDCDQGILDQKPSIKYQILKNENGLEDRCHLIEKLKMQYIWGAYRVDLIWLPDGRRVVIFFDYHTHNPRKEENLGHLLMEFFDAHYNTPFDLILETSRVHDIRLEKGDMFDFGVFYDKCFGMTDQARSVLIEGCPPNVRYHEVDIRLPAPNNRERQKLLEAKFLEFFQPKKTPTLPAFLLSKKEQDLKAAFLHLINTTREYGFENVLPFLSEASKQALATVLAKRTLGSSDETTLASSIMDIFSIATYEKTYNRSQYGFFDDKMMNTVFWTGGYHSQNYTNYFLTMYPRSKALSFYPDGRVVKTTLDFGPASIGMWFNRINLGNYNLHNFFTGEV